MLIALGANDYLFLRVFDSLGMDKCFQMFKIISRSQVLSLPFIGKCSNNNLFSSCYMEREELCGL